MAWRSEARAREGGAGSWLDGVLLGTNLLLPIHPLALLFAVLLFIDERFHPGSKHHTADKQREPQGHHGYEKFQHQSRFLPPSSLANGNG